MTKITILTDNTAGKNCLAEHGLSYLIEADEKILLDTGHSDVFLKNAALLDINLDTVKHVVLSHGHWDHADGLRYLKGKSLICHPEVFSHRYRKADHSYIGMEETREEIGKRFNLVESKEPHRISENVWFLGQIPRTNDFEAQTTSFEFADGEEDYVIDDSAIVVKSDKGLILVSGCAHSGICNMISYTESLFPGIPVHAVMGGFHLVSEKERIRKTIEYLKDKGIDRVIPSHCTGFSALSELYQSFGFQQIKTGNILRF